MPEAVAVCQLQPERSAEWLCATYPTYGDVTIAPHEAYSHCDALQVCYEQRIVARLTLLNSFTWPHALDNAGGIAAVTG